MQAIDFIDVIILFVGVAIVLWGIFWIGAAFRYVFLEFLKNLSKIFRKRNIARRFGTSRIGKLDGITYYPSGLALVLYKGEPEISRRFFEAFCDFNNGSTPDDWRVAVEFAN